MATLSHCHMCDQTTLCPLMLRPPCTQPPATAQQPGELKEFVAADIRLARISWLFFQIIDNARNWNGFHFCN